MEDRVPSRPAAAQSHSPAPAGAPRCAVDSYRWSKVTFQTVLAGASDTEELELPAHGSATLKLEIRPVHPLVAVMTAGAMKAGANPRDAVASLEEKAGEGLGQVGTQLKIPEPDVHFTVKILNETAVPDRGRFLRGRFVSL
jgi:hypothetical protein